MALKRVYNYKLIELICILMHPNKMVYSLLESCLLYANVKCSVCAHTYVQTYMYICVCESTCVTLCTRVSLCA